MVAPVRFELTFVRVRTPLSHPFARRSHSKIGTLGQIRTDTVTFLRRLPHAKLGYEGIGREGGIRTRTTWLEGPAS